MDNDRNNAAAVLSPAGIALLELGRGIVTAGGSGVSHASSPSRHAASPDPAAAIAILRGMGDAAKAFTLRDGEADATEVRVFATAAYLGLMGDFHPDVRLTSELVGGEMTADIMLARAAIRRLCERGLLTFKNGQPKPWNGCLLLSPKALTMIGVCRPHGPVFGEKALGNPVAAEDADADAAPVGKTATKACIPTASVLYTRIRGTVIGAYIEEPVRTIAATFTAHLHRARMIAAGSHPGTPNLVSLLIGSPSSGKTHLAETAARCVNAACGENTIPFTSFSATDITAEGYVGCSVDDCLKPIIEQCGGNAARARAGCVFLDEIDKKACRTARGSLDVGGRGVQEGLLRILGGTMVTVGGRRNAMERQAIVNTDGMMFVLGGAFQGLAELMGRQRRGRIGFGTDTAADRKRIRDCLVEYGLIPELVSRTGSIVLIRDPGFEDMVEICTAPGGVLTCYGRLWEGMGLKVAVTTGGVRVMAGYGIETRSFARGMQSVLTRLCGRRRESV